MSYNVLNAVCFIMFYQYMYRIAPSLSSLLFHICESVSANQVLSLCTGGLLEQAVNVGGLPHLRFGICEEFGNLRSSRHTEKCMFALYSQLKTTVF